MATKNTSTSMSIQPTLLAVAGALLLCATVMIVSLIGRPAGGLTVPKSTKVIHVQEFDFGIRMRSGPLPTGNVVFVDMNRGTVPHELVMFKMAGPAAKPPLQKNGEFNEDSTAVENVLDSGSALAPGETRILSADLDPGTYIMVCNLPQHYRLGMHRIVTAK